MGELKIHYKRITLLIDRKAKTRNQTKNKKQKTENRKQKTGNRE
jgi:hypothetical protein